MLILKNIKKKYNSSKKYVLKNINLAFKETGLICILGESGSGKTTLLNIIGGLDNPTEGAVYIDRINIEELKEEKSLYNQYIGFIFQNYNLINYMTTKENINLLSKLKINSILKKLNITKLENKLTNNLSGGEKQRVAIARALAKDKKILLCDEPTGALDSENSEAIMKVLKRLSKDHLVIVVTHNRTLATLYSDRIIELKDGEISSDTDPYNIKERKRKYTFNKSRYSLNSIINYVIQNIRLKKKKSIFNVLALAIGLISLLLVLSISIGFNKSIEYAEKDSLAEHPIYISKNSINLEEEISGLKEEYDNEINYIYSKDLNHQNIIDQNLLNYISLVEEPKYKVENYFIDNIPLTLFKQDIESEANLLYGVFPQNNYELILMVDSNNIIDNNILLSINLKEERYRLDELINYEFEINYNTYKIVGIAKFKEESILYDSSGLYLTENISNMPLPYEIYLYPKNYNNKLTILKHLDNYDNLQYTDYSTTVKNVSTTIIDSITIILIAFSLITLIVSCLMTYILTLISITDRTRDIGILKVNGISNMVIKLMFYLENYLLSTLSLLISIILVGIISIPINNILEYITGLKDIMIIDTNIIIIVSLITFILTFISTYIPTRKISKMKIIDNLMYN